MSTPASSPQTRRRPPADPSELSGSQISLPSSPKPGIRLVPYSPPRFEERTASRLSDRSSNSEDGSASADGAATQQAAPVPPSPCPSPLAPPAFIVAASHSPSPRPLPLPSSSDHSVVSDDTITGRQTPGLEPSISRTISNSDSIISATPGTGSTAMSALSSLALTDTHSSVSTPHSGLSLDAPGARPRPCPLDEIDEVDEMDDVDGGSSIAELPRQSHLPRRSKFVAVHSDKTFSLVPLSRGSSSSSKSHTQQSYSHTRFPSLAYRAPPSVSVASTAASSTLGRQSDIFFDDRPSSPATTIPDVGTSPCGSVTSEVNWVAITPAPSPSPSLFPTGTTGELRKVPRTPDLKHSRRDWPAAPPAFDSSPETFVARAVIPATPPAPFNIARTARNQGLQLVTKPSLQSIQSYSSELDTPNYRTYGAGSPETPSVLSLDASFSELNRPVFYTTSPVNPSSPVDEPDRDDNYVVYGSPSQSSSSLTTIRNPPRLHPQFSQESLTVAPLKPGRRVSIERHHFGNSRSRESLRRTPSLASISSYFTHEAIHAFLTTPAPVHHHRSASGGSALSQLARRLDHPSSTTAPPQPLEQVSTAVVSSQALPSSMVSQPHQWSSHLSTVESESEAGSDFSSRPGSSLVSAFGVTGGRRSGSSYPSNHGRHSHSISSIVHSRSLSDPLEAGSSSFVRSGYRDGSHVSPPINYQDEDGDGLADLHELQHRPSRRRLSAFFSNSNSSDYNLHSSASSRANSFSSASLPTWARLYYGSGERKLLMPSSDSLYSAFVRDRDAQHNVHSFVADPELLQTNLRTQRHHAAEVVPPTIIRPPSAAASVGMVIQPATGLRAAIRKKTSSIWSPHLVHDRRASRYSIWVPPQNHWASESAQLGRRTVQRFCFIAGFIFPFAWMVASFLPLPPNPAGDVAISDATNPDFRRDLERHKAQTLQEVKYRSARWWRHINRCMSIFGLLVVAAAIALVVVGVHERWGMPH